MKAFAWGVWILAALMILAALTGCRSDEVKPTPAPPTIPAPEPDPAPEPPACNATENKSLRLLSLGMFERLPRIVGGMDANIADYPWMLAVTTPSGFQYCGASLIDATTALTAAHCKVLPGDNVIARRTRLSDAGGYRVSVAKAITHGDYNPRTNYWDASLLTLSQPLPGPYVELGDAEQSGSATAIGWGLLREGDQRATDTLQHVIVPIVDNVACDAAYGDIESFQMCAGQAGKDTCQGDSGGPLLCQGKQCGITSFGIGCARPGLPGVYQRTTPLQEWIAACK